MKKIILIISMSLLLVGCSDGEKESAGNENKLKEERVVVKKSTDKSIEYVKNYVGRNADDIGYQAMNGNFLEKYGEALVQIVFLTESGEQVNSDNRSEFVITKQNVDPNTEINLTFKKDKDGKEYDSLIDTQSIDEIELTAKRIKEKEE